MADLKVEIAAGLRHGDFGGPGYAKQRKEAEVLHVIPLALDSTFHSSGTYFGCRVFAGTDSSRGVRYRFLYLHVAAAAAEIAGEISSYLLRCRSRILCQKALRAQDEARCAIGALKSIVVNKCLLDRMEFAVLGRASMVRSSFARA